MTTLVRDMRIGYRYSLNGQIVGILCEKRVIYDNPSSAPLYKIVFQQKNSKIGLIKEWNKEFLHIKDYVKERREE
jgi:hypothetical protein